MNETKKMTSDYVRSAMGCPLTFDRGSTDRCVGDCCMWWRWRAGPIDERQIPDDQSEDQREGFCGIAGKP